MVDSPDFSLLYIPKERSSGEPRSIIAPNAESSRDGPIVTASNDEHHDRRTLTGAAGLIGVFTLVSRLLGLLREMAVAWIFGAKDAADAFYVAFRLPNLLRELAAEGSMSAGFIPVFTQYLSTRSRQEARQLANASFTILCVTLAIVSCIGLLASPWLVRAIAPGFSDNVEKFNLTVLLTRIMFPYLLFIGLAALTMGVLNSLKAFRAPALASSAFNVCVIVVTVGLASRLDQPVIAVAIGVLVGGLAQFVVQLPSLAARGMSFRWRWAPSHPGLRQMFWLILPTTIGLSVSQVNLVVNTLLASLLPGGSVAYLNYAMRLIQFPLGLFGVAVATAILPTLSNHATLGEKAAFRQTTLFGLRLVFFITVPSMVGLIVLREPIVQVLFQHGAFDARATTGTANALLAYSLGLWAFAGVRVVVQAFYALQDTRTPVRAAVAAMAINIVLNLLLMGPFQHTGLALATSISSIINFTWLLYLLVRRQGGFDLGALRRSHGKVLLASLTVVLIAWPIGHMALWQQDGQAWLKGCWLAFGLAGSVGGFCAASAWLGSEELAVMWQLVRQKFDKRP
jgi:putative peptidoglycan lipid II flippase